MRWENAAFISPANSSVIREEEHWREGERRKREGWREGKIGTEGRGGRSGMQLWSKADWAGATWKKKKKSDRSRNLTGIIDFFFPPTITGVFSASCCLFSKHSNLRGHLRRPLAYRLPFIYIHLFFSCVTPPTASLWSASQFTIISTQFFILLPGTSTLVICRFSPPYYRDMMALTLPSVCSRCQSLIFQALCLLLVMITVNAQIWDEV